MLFSVLKLFFFISAMWSGVVIDIITKYDVENMEYCRDGGFGIQISITFFGAL